MLPIYHGQCRRYLQAYDRGRIDWIRMEDMDRQDWQGHWLPTTVERDSVRFLALINDRSTVRL
jgi:hypothetical protein